MFALIKFILDKINLYPLLQVHQFVVEMHSDLPVEGVAKMTNVLLQAYKMMNPCDLGYSWMYIYEYYNTFS